VRAHRASSKAAPRRVHADLAWLGDTLAPVISRLRVLPARSWVRFRLSEPAGVTIRLVRASRPRLARSLRVSGREGANTSRLRRRLVRALRSGRYPIKVSARDAAGNEAKRKSHGYVFAADPRPAGH
jgi:hypothetical protein